MYIKQPVFYEYEINRMHSVDLISVGHVDNRDNDFIELKPVQNGEQIDISNSTVTARYVMRKNNELISDGVPCSVNESGNILIPFDNAAISSRKGDMNIEISITESGKTATLPFPLWVRVRPSVLDNAEVTPDSKGTVAALLEEVKQELARVEGFVDEETVSQMIEERIAEISVSYPELHIDNTVDAQYNPNGDYILYYYDTGHVRQNLLNFSSVFYTRTEINELIGGIENGSY